MDDVRGAATAGRRRRRARAVPLLAAVAAVSMACTAPPSPDPAPPVISSFEAVANRTEAPATVTLGWTVADANQDQLTCRVDVDGDGTLDRTVTDCDSADRVLTQSLAAGERTFTLEVDDGSSPPVRATTSVTTAAGPAEPFDITLRFDPDVRPEFRDAFTAAAQRWQRVILAGNPDQPLQLPGGLFGWTPAFDGVVDDVMIDVQTPVLDGPGSLLGQAGGYLIRPGGKQPYYGVMQLDAADLDGELASGQLVTLITHEMGHVLGIGLNFVLAGQVTDYFGADPRHTGRAAVAAWQELGGTGNVPLENTGGTGTALVHWRESIFDRELMTGWQEFSGAEPLSRVTVGALADLDYGVDLDGADPFTLGAGLRAPWPIDGAGTHLHTEPVVPVGTTLVGGVPTWAPAGG